MSPDISETVAVSQSVGQAASGFSAGSENELQCPLPQQKSLSVMHEAPFYGEQDGPSDGSLEGAVSSLNQFIQNYRRDMQFSIDESSGRVVVKVIDMETREVIRQIPYKEVMTLVRGLEKSKGELLHANA